MNYEPVIAGKWLDLLKEIAPGTNQVLMLTSPDGNAAVASGFGLERTS